jgi:hypothetical protein
MRTWNGRNYGDDDAPTPLQVRQALSTLQSVAGVAVRSTEGEPPPLPKRKKRTREEEERRAAFRRHKADEDTSDSASTDDSSDGESTDAEEEEEEARTRAKAKSKEVSMRAIGQRLDRLGADVRAIEAEHTREVRQTRTSDRRVERALDRLGGRISCYEPIHEEIARQREQGRNLRPRAQVFDSNYPAEMIAAAMGLESPDDVYRARDLARARAQEALAARANASRVRARGGAMSDEYLARVYSPSQARIIRDIRDGVSRPKAGA